VLALMADNVEAARDPDYVWGIACREILGPIGMGLVGLMLASLLAALMSSADCYMLTSSALIVRNVYAAYLNPHASERTYINVGRLASLLVIAGGAGVVSSQ
jgi:SSS family solute:Na+ symporter